jgi:uncharacterized protein YjbI with pentapeptide repeats
MIFQIKTYTNGMVLFSIDTDTLLDALQTAVAQGVNLNDAELSNQNFAGANLAGALLRDADLRNTNFNGANLMNSDLQGANLDYAQMIGTNLQNANLTGAKTQSMVTQPATVSGGQNPPVAGPQFPTTAWDED